MDIKRPLRAFDRFQQRHSPGGVAVSVGLNLVVFGAIFKLFGTSSASLRDLLPGIVVAAVCWVALQLLGGYFVSHQIRNATPAYGTFALVAELNVVRARGLWPRSLLGWSGTRTSG